MSTNAPRQRLARVIGALYLVQMATGVFGQSFVRDRLIAPGDAAKSAQNIIGAEQLFRLSIAGDLVTYIAVIVLTWALYILLRPVDQNLALLAAFFRLVENAVLCFATVGSLFALKLVRGAVDLPGFEASRLNSTAALALNAQGLAMTVGFVFLGLGSAVFAFVLLKSRYIPKALAAWGVFASLLLAIGTLTTIVCPGLGVVGLAYMVPMGLYEVGLGFWLLVKGVRVPLPVPSPTEA